MAVRVVPVVLSLPAFLASSEVVGPGPWDLRGLPQTHPGSRVVAAPLVVARLTGFDGSLLVPKPAGYRRLA